MRIGVLGASGFAPITLLGPARGHAEVVVAAVGGRGLAHAREFADEHGIARAHGSYEELVADPDLDAVYVVLPTSMHGRWTKAAIAAGKHVLCEKPFTANAAEAREIADLDAATPGRVVMEAVQYRHHPLTLRVQEIIASGELGRLQRIDIALCVMLRHFSGNCYNYDFAGGAMMDAGSYVVNMLRTFGGSTPEVVAAQAKLLRPNVDRAMRARVVFPEGHTGRIRVSLWSSDLYRAQAKIVGERGHIRIISPAAPHLFPWLTIRSDGRTRVERFPRRATYAYQLDALAASVLRGDPVRTPPRDAVENMTVIDEIYRAAGLPVRVPS